MFYLNELIFGAVFFWFALLMDGLDGKVARLTKTQSKLGRKLDYFTDKINTLIMLFGIWWSQYYLQGQWFLGFSFILLHYLIMFSAIFIKNESYNTIFPNPKHRICNAQ